MEEQNSKQPILIITSRVTPKAYRRFFRHGVSHFHKRYWVSLALCLFFLALLTAANIWLIKNGSYEFTSIWLLVILIALYSPGRFYYMHRAMYKSETHYAFYEAHFCSYCDVLGTRHMKATPYQNCRAAETKSAFYLYRAAKRSPPPDPYGNDIADPDPYGASVILDKEQLSPEQQQALRELLARKYG
jgi:hypothetical protein